VSEKVGRLRTEVIKHPG